MALQNYQTVLVGVDGSDQANVAFKKAVEVARRNQGRVIVTRVIENRSYTMMGYSSLNDDLLQQEEADAKALIEACKYYVKNVDFHDLIAEVSYGDSKEVLTKEFPMKYHVDLIMIGQSGLNAVERLMTGSVATYIVRHAPCDVLVVHPEKE